MSPVTLTRRELNQLLAHKQQGPNAPRRRRAVPCPLEAAEQRALFQWTKKMQVSHPELAYVYHIPNAGGYRGGFRANAQRVAGMLLEGLKPGYPDIGLDIARGPFFGLRIELKRVRGSVVSKQQKDWLAWLQGAGYYAVVCRGAEEAKVVLMEYLSLPPHTCKHPTPHP